MMVYDMINKLCSANKLQLSGFFTNIKNIYIKRQRETL